jgi:hypothetical protein
VFPPGGRHGFVADTVPPCERKRNSKKNINKELFWYQKFTIVRRKKPQAADDPGSECRTKHRHGNNLRRNPKIRSDHLNRAGEKK